MNGTIDAASTQQGVVGGIDNCIDLQLGDIGFQYPDSFHGFSLPGTYF
jgi:hypothetical protein